MSTKTLRKRIALVAVSAMGFGLLSSVAATAAVGTNDGEMLAQTTAATGTYGVIGSPVTTTGAQTITITTAGRVAVGLNAAAGAHVNLTGPCYAGTTAASGAATASGTSISASGLTVTTAGTTDTYFQIVPTAVGSCVAKSYAGTSESAATDKITISVVASTSVATFSTSKSFAELIAYGSANGSASTYADAAGANLVTNGNEATVDFSLNDSNGTAMPSTTVVTASATNGALVSFGTGTEAATSATTTAAAGTVWIAQPTSNAPVSTVVTISVNGAVWVTKSLTITGDIATVKLTSAAIGRTASSGTVTGSFKAAAYDAAGNLVATTINSDGSRYTAAVSSADATITTSASDTVAGSFTCRDKGTANLSYSVTNAALAKIVSNDLAVACAGDPYTYTAKLDKSSYKPGEVATLTVAAVDSKGNKTNALATIGTASTAVPTISGAQLTVVTAPAVTDTFTSVDGAAVYKFTVGTTEGDYSLIVDLPKWQAGANSSSSTQTAVTVPYSVKASTSAVSNADVLAAIVKLIASINKQIAALQKSLKK